jgi:hypothetical protein
MGLSTTCIFDNRPGRMKSRAIHSEARAQRAAYDRSLSILYSTGVAKLFANFI